MQKNWKTTLHQKSTSKGSKKEKRKSPKLENNSHFPVLMVQSNCLKMVRIVILPSVDDISGCLLGEEDDGSDLAKELKDATEAKHDCWRISGSFISRHHVTNREYFLCFEKIISFSINLHSCCPTLNRIWTCYKNTKPTIVGERRSSGSWIGFTIFTVLKKPPPERHMCAGDRLTKIQITFRRDENWPGMWSNMSNNSQREARRQ